MGSSEHHHALPLHPVMSLGSRPWMRQWLLAASIRLFGFNPLAVHLPIWLCAAAAVALCWRLSRSWVVAAVLVLTAVSLYWASAAAAVAAQPPVAPQQLRCCDLGPPSSCPSPAHAPVVVARDEVHCIV